MILGVNQSAIAVPNIEHALAFYCETIGLSIGNINRVCLPGGAMGLGGWLGAHAQGRVLLQVSSARKRENS